MESGLEWHQAKALLEWYVELGVSDAVAEAPINRYELPDTAPKVPRATRAASAAPGPGPDAAPSALSSAPIEVAKVDWVAEARAAAAAAASIEDLAAAVQAFEGAPIKKGARNFVFADGTPGARVMVVGDAPNAQEDRDGRPFVGREGQLFDQMFAAIGMSRSAPETRAGLYVTTPLPWRPPGNRSPTPQEIEMFRPFLLRHVELAQPDVVIAMGNTACLGLLGQSGLTRLRGSWREVADRALLPMFHPSYLLLTPTAKRQAWADLLTLQARLRETP